MRSACRTGARHATLKRRCSSVRAQRLQPGLTCTELSEQSATHSTPCTVPRFLSQIRSLRLFRTLLTHLKHLQQFAVASEAASSVIRGRGLHCDEGEACVCHCCSGQAGSALAQAPDNIVLLSMLASLAHW